MAWKTLPLCVLPLLASCSDPDAWGEAKPGTLEIDRIERQLVRLPCVGALDRWERHFEYALAYGQPETVMRADRNRISFTFIEATREPYRPRRILYGPDLDEVSPPAVWGEYHVASGRIFLLTCGEETGRLPRSRIEAFIRWQSTP
jgi:hypothetical protein